MSERAGFGGAGAVGLVAGVSSVRDLGDDRGGMRVKTLTDLVNEIARLILSGHWTNHELAVMLSEFAQERVGEDRARRTADDLYKLSYQRGLKDALEWVKAEARDCGCSDRIEKHIEKLL